jgi:tetratricopeptide (TPR) repeat protein
MDVLSAIVCPVCGGPFTRVETNCPYCGVLVVIRGDHQRIDPARLDRGVINQRIADYRDALRKDRRDADARYGLGVAYYSLGLVDEAIEELQHAAKLMPENPHLQAQLGVVTFETSMNGGSGALDQAWKHLDRTLLLDPRNEEGLVLKEALLREKLRSSDPSGAVFAAGRSDLLQTWRELAAVNESRVRPLIADYLQRNESLMMHLLKARGRFDSLAGRPQPIRATWFWKAFGLSIGTFVACVLIASLLLALTQNDAGEIESGWANALFTILIILSMIAPVIVFVRGYRRRPRSAFLATPANATRPPLVDAVLAGTAPIGQMLELSEAVLNYETP